jgi:plastocyanin
MSAHRWVLKGLLACLLAAASPAAWAGDVQGTVTFSGPAPAAEALPVNKDTRVCGQTVPDETLLVSGGRLANVVVTVEGAPAAPAAKLTLDQQKCRFVPHVLVAPLGSTLEIVNSDPLLHNIHGWQGLRTRFNVPMPSEGTSDPTRLEKSGVIQVRCDVHAWMGAYVVVPEGAAALSGADGTFVVRGVPPGTYKVKAWHERLGEKTAQVTVPAQGAPPKVNFAFTR